MIQLSDTETLQLSICAMKAQNNSLAISLMEKLVSSQKNEKPTEQDHVHDHDKSSQTDVHYIVSNNSDSEWDDVVRLAHAGNVVHLKLSTNALQAASSVLSQYDLASYRLGVQYKPILCRKSKLGDELILFLNKGKLRKPKQIAADLLNDIVEKTRDFVDPAFDRKTVTPSSGNERYGLTWARVKRVELYLQQFHQVSIEIQRDPATGIPVTTFTYLRKTDDQ